MPMSIGFAVQNSTASAAMRSAFSTMPAASAISQPPVPGTPGHVARPCLAVLAGRDGELRRCGEYFLLDVGPFARGEVFPFRLELHRGVCRQDILVFDRQVDDLLDQRLLCFLRNACRILLHRRRPVSVYAGTGASRTSTFLAIALALATSVAISVMRRISSSVTIGLLANPQTPL